VWILNKLKQMDTGIYKITNTITNDLYIGSAAGKTGIKRRFESHKYHLRRGTSPCLKLQNSWNKYGEEHFTFSILEYCEPIDCINREQYFIDKLNPSLNILPIAGSRLNSKQSKEAKEKISNRLKGCDVWNKGVKMAESHKLKIGAANKGKTHTKEAKTKISKAKVGKLNPNASMVRCVEKNMIFETMKDAVKYLEILLSKKVYSSSISACCRGVKYKKAYGFTWEYVK